MYSYLLNYDKRQIILYENNHIRLKEIFGGKYRKLVIATHIYKTNSKIP